MQWTAVLLLVKVVAVSCFNINEGDHLPRGYNIHTIPTLQPAWYVSLEVKPFATVTGWSNVFHFTAFDNDLHNYGSRVPAMWFTSGSTRPWICSAVSNNRDYCYHGAPLPLNTYSKIDIQQRFTNAGFIYEIIINGIRVHHVLNIAPLYFSNVKVYRSDPWYVPASAQVRNLIFGNLPNDYKLVRNTQIKSYNMYFQEYDISFEIKPNGIITSWASILHVTLGRNIDRYGDRIPAIWFRPGTTRFHICSAVNNNKNYVYDSPSNIPTNKFTKVRVTQKWNKAANKYRYNIYIDGKRVHSVINNNPVTLRNVKVYAADPWHSPANAIVKNIVVKTSQGAGFQPKKGYILAHIPHVGTQWYVSFDVKPTAEVNGFSSIIHMTLGGNIGRIGDRMPGVWFRPSSQRLHICVPLNGNKNYCFDTTSVSTSEFTNIQIRQTWDVASNKHVYNIALNGVVEHTAISNQPQEFDDVTFYTSDPWYQPAKAIVKNLVFKNLPYGYTYADCKPARAPVLSCDKHKPITSYRSVDGTCNNLQNPTWGSSETPLRRLLAPAYAEDGKKDTPRGFPGTNPILPPSNAVSQQLFLVERENTGSEKHVTTLFMTFGQFLDHDVTATPHSSCKQSCDTFNAWQYPCFPLLFNDSSVCSPNGRSHPVCSNEAYISPRQQRNDLSAFIDGSQIYSNDLQLFKTLRTQTDGKMKVTDDGLLPVAQNQGSPGCFTLGGCSLVGDFRADENIALHAMHTLWVREHNRIADELKALNPTWKDEKLFQTARKINSAIWQHITYKEYVPLLATLKPYTGYKAKVNPSITNVFATAAFRYGHSLVPNEFAQLDNNFDKMNDSVLLQEAFFNRQIINENGIEPTLRGLVGNMSNDVDNSFAFAVARKLFIGVGGSGYLDLTALNIQRGRDHGLPSYNEFRKYCKLKVADTWGELESFMLKDASERFKKIYKSADDIDLFAGGISEKHLPNLQIGETFNCLLSRQFNDLRDGDRFYYENTGVFTSSQLDAIKEVTMATVLCNNVNGLVSIQPDAFHTPEEKNERKVCGSIPKLDLQPWAEESNEISVSIPEEATDKLGVEDFHEEQHSQSRQHLSKKELLTRFEKRVVEKVMDRLHLDQPNTGDADELLDDEQTSDDNDDLEEDDLNDAFENM